MKPIGNIFGFDCATCEHNRHCYGGNMGNQFRYCQKSAEKIQNLDNLEKQNKQLKDNWNKLKEDLINDIKELQYNALEQQKFNDLLKENEELKKKLEERTKMYQNAYKYGQRMEDVTITLKAEQKEFIKYLEDMLDDENDIFSVVRVKDILSKYKEIAGE